MHEIVELFEAVVTLGGSPVMFPNQARQAHEAIPIKI